MKALVLSGGAGIRLRRLTHTSAERPVPVAGKAVLVDGPETPADAGITPVGVIVGDGSGRAPREQPGNGLPLIRTHRRTPTDHAAVRAVEPPRRGELEIIHPLRPLHGAPRALRGGHGEVRVPS